MGALFVTATGTDIGKTFVSAGIIRALRRRGRPIEVLKPVMSGFSDENAVSSDAGLLLTALGRPTGNDEIARIAPWRFAVPLSPDMAAHREGRAIDFGALIDFSRHAIDIARDALLIEGVGGVMVPLDDSHTVADWIAALRIPALLIAGSYLGTISHTLTALEVLRRRSIAVPAVLVTETPGSTVDLEETRAVIARHAGGVPTLVLPRLTAGEVHPAFERLAELL